MTNEKLLTEGNTRNAQKSSNNVRPIAPPPALIKYQIKRKII